MRQLVLDQCAYGDNLPTGEYMAVSPDARAMPVLVARSLAWTTRRVSAKRRAIPPKCVTHLGDLPIPAQEIQPGPKLMFNRITNVGGFKIASKSHSGDTLHVFRDGAWSTDPRVSHGTQGHLWTPTGDLMVLPPAADQDSQGLRYYDPSAGPDANWDITGSTPGCVTGSPTYNWGTPFAVRNGILPKSWEFTILGRYVVAQADGGVTIQDRQIGTRYWLINGGDCRFIQAKQGGSTFAVAMTRFYGGPRFDVLFLWFEESEIAGLSPYTEVVQPPPPPEKIMYRNFGSQFTDRWNALGIPQKTAEIAQRNRVTPRERKMLVQLSEARKFSKRLRVGASKRTLDLEEQFKAVQCAALVQIAGELHHAQGFADVGLSAKPSGNNWPIPGGAVATDIITVKPTNEQGQLIAGNFVLVDCVSSVGSADAKPTWQVLGPNTDNARPWVQPPAPGNVIDPPPPTGTHRYIGGGNDTGECDQCHKPKLDQVHRVPEGLVKHAPWFGEDGKGDCDLCFQPATADIHNMEEPPVEKHEFAGTGRFCTECGKSATDPVHQIDPPVEKHPFNGTGRFCTDCGKVPADPVHQIATPGGGTFDDTRIVAALNAMLAEQRNTTAAINKLRTDLLAAFNGFTAKLPDIIGTLAALLVKKLPINRASKK